MNDRGVLERVEKELVESQYEESGDADQGIFKPTPRKMLQAHPGRFLRAGPLTIVAIATL